MYICFEYTYVVRLVSAFTLHWFLFNVYLFCKRHVSNTFSFKDLLQVEILNFSLWPIVRIKLVEVENSLYVELSSADVNIDY